MNPGIYIFCILKNIEDVGRDSGNDSSKEDAFYLMSFFNQKIIGTELTIHSIQTVRSETERLLRLAEQQSNRLAENMTYIKELEDRELIFTQNVRLDSFCEILFSFFPLFALCTLSSAEVHSFLPILRLNNSIYK